MIRTSNYLTGICGSAFTAINAEIDSMRKAYPVDRTENTEKPNVETNNVQNAKDDANDSNGKTTGLVDLSAKGINVV